MMSPGRLLVFLWQPSYDLRAGSAALSAPATQSVAKGYFCVHPQPALHFSGNQLLICCQLCSRVFGTQPLQIAAHATIELPLEGGKLSFSCLRQYMWLLKHKKMDCHHSFLHFGQSVVCITLSVVPLKLIEMPAEERNCTGGPAQYSGPKWSVFISWIFNGSSVLYLRTSVYSSPMEIEPFQNVEREKLNAGIESFSVGCFLTINSVLIQYPTCKIVQL